MVIVAVGLTGCRSRALYVEAPVVESVRDTVRERATVSEQVWVRDSVYVEGPEVYRERVVWRERRVTDTVYVSRTDTVVETRVPASYPGVDGSGKRVNWRGWAVMIVMAMATGWLAHGRWKR